MEIFQDLSGSDLDGGGWTEASLLQAVPAAEASLWRETFHAGKKKETVHTESLWKAPVVARHIPPTAVAFVQMWKQKERKK